MECAGVKVLHLTGCKILHLTGYDVSDAMRTTLALDISMSKKSLPIVLLSMVEAENFSDHPRRAPLLSLWYAY
jgi:hypothetical protein